MTALLHAGLYTGIALWLLTGIGNALCRRLLIRTGLKAATAQHSGSGHPAGRIIGGLERLILALGLLGNSWEILAAVIALKTVARFKELDRQDFAEYFLVGSLFSILWAILITGAWILYDGHFGVGVRAILTEWLTTPVLPPLMGTMKSGS